MAEELIRRLDLAPGTCGYMGQTYRSSFEVGISGRSKRAGAARRIRTDRSAGLPARPSEQLQLLVPGNAFHVGRVDGAAALLGTTSWPEIRPDEFELGDEAALRESHPAYADQLAELQDRA